MVLAMTHTSPARAVSVVYVGNAESHEIVVLQLEQQTGDLRLIERVPIPNVMQPGISTPMAVSPDRRFLYVGVRGQPQRGVIKSVSGPQAGGCSRVAQY